MAASAVIETDDALLERQRLIDRRIRAAEVSLTRRRLSMVQRHALNALILTDRQELALLDTRRSLNALLREIEEEPRG